MNMTSKILPLIFVLLFSVAFPVQATTKDVLVISLVYTKSTSIVEITGIEQRVMEEQNFNLNKTGDIKVTLSDITSIVSENYFNTSGNDTIEVIGGPANEQPAYVPAPDQRAFNIKLPITKPVLAEETKLIVSRGNDVLLEKKLSDLPLEIMEIKTNAITVNYLEPVIPANHSDTLNYVLIAGIVLISLTVTATGYWLMKKRHTPLPPPDLPETPSSPVVPPQELPPTPTI